MLFEERRPARKQQICQWLLVGLFSLLCTHAGLAVADDAKAWPAELSQWQNWVLQKHPDHSCPWLGDGQQKQCQWLRQTRLNLHKNGGDFRLELQQFQQLWFSLPGDVRHWPLDIVATDQLGRQQQVAVRDFEGIPQIQLGAGSWIVEGRFRWQELPAQLQLPVQTSVLQLSIDGQVVTEPKLTDTTLWLKPSDQTTETTPDQLAIEVYRQFDDQNPALLTTRLHLHVSGKTREVLLKAVVLPPFQPIKLHSDQPAQLQADGSILLQVSAGSWLLELQSQSDHPITSIQLPPAVAPWPKDEIWAFVARSELRTVVVQGGTSLDPTQTQVPDEWRNDPLYRVHAAEQLQFVVQNPSEQRFRDDLRLQKTAWLDFSGNYWTVADEISGNLASSSRFNVSPHYQLGRVEVDGNAQLITQLMPHHHADPDPIAAKTADKTINAEIPATAQALAGVEIRQNPVQLSAISRLTAQQTLPVSGWQTSFSAVDLTLQLPPGWSLFTATGADQIQGSWLARWTLWDIFFVLLLATACGRLFGWPYAVLSLSTLLMIYQRSAAPTMLWLVLVALLGLLQVATGRSQLWLQRLGQLCALALLLQLLPFSVAQFRTAIYPQLEQPQLAMMANQNRPDASDEYSEREQAKQAYARRNMEKQQQEQSRQKVMEASAPPPVAMMAEPMSAAASGAASVELSQSDLSGSSDATAALPAQPGNARLQTGPARPDWQWTSAHLSWQGPVLAEERTHIYLVPAWLNRLGSVLAVVLALWLWFRLSQQLWPKLTQQFQQLATKLPQRGPSNVVMLALLLSGAVVISPPGFSQTIPDAQLLQELEQRLLTPPDCLPHCSSIEQLSISETQSAGLRLNLVVQQQISAAWQLPLPARQFSAIRLGTQSVPVWSDSTDQGWVLLPAGRHQLELQIMPGKANQLQLRFATPWHHLQTDLPLAAAQPGSAARHAGWQLITDVEQHNQGQTDLTSLQQSRRQLMLKRTGALTSGATSSTQPQGSTTTAEPGAILTQIQPKARLTRTIQLGVEWQLISTLERIGQSMAPLSLAVPLLAGEKALSQAPVQDGKLQLVLAQDQQRLSWNSRLEPSSLLTLQASNDNQYHEVWQLAPSGQWHVKGTGVAAIARQQNPLPSLWRPWPGEQLKLQISEPTAAPGPTLTILQTQLQQRQGKRTSDIRLELTILASLAQNFQQPLPQDAQLQSIELDGQNLPLQQNLEIALRPGLQQLVLHWKQPLAQGFFNQHFVHHTPAMDINQPLANIYLQLDLSQDRWLLAVGGPAMGPALLFWGLLAVVLVLAWNLPKVIPSPLGRKEWLLLFAGISTVSLWLPVLIAMWLFALSRRGQLSQPLSGVSGKLQQLGLILLSISTLTVLLLSIPYGLLSQPDMHLVGNGSYQQQLRWFQDLVMLQHNQAQLPQGWAFSLPLWCYQLAMLLWSLWLATALLRWLPWAWAQLCHLRFWPAATAKVEPAAENNSPTSPAEQLQQDKAGSPD